MTIDPTTLPEGTVVETAGSPAVIREGGNVSAFFRGGTPYAPDEPITRVFVPVPVGMTYADAEAALADAGAWVQTPEKDIPFNARVREEYRGWQDEADPARFYVHRDDLPPADPDAELVEKMARAIHAKEFACAWDELHVDTHDEIRQCARAALAVVREHEAKS